MMGLGVPWLLSEPPGLAELLGEGVVSSPRRRLNAVLSLCHWERGAEGIITGPPAASTETV